jgi:DNA modification methylase
VVLATLDPIGALATRDDERLRMLLAEVQFDAEALREMTANLLPIDPKVGLTDPDDVPELADDSGIKPGDLFALGDHRLMCGDSTKAEDLARLMGGAKADMVFTDPPYGVEVTSRIGTRGVASSAVRGSGRATVANDGLDVDALTIFLRSAFAAAASVTEPGAAWYVCAPQGPVGLAFAATLAELDVWRHGLVWVKDSLVMGRADYHYRHEAIYYGWTPGGSHHAVTDRTQDSVWEIPRPKRSEEHPTMKPVDLVARAVTNSTDPRQIILDTFVGSGTTIIAAEQLGRRCYAMEIDPRYVAVAIKRWEQFTGRQAVKLDG